MLSKKQIDEVIKIVAGLNPEAIYPTGHKKAIAGYVETAQRGVVFAIDVETIIKKLVDEGMKRDEAVEFFDYNIIGTRSEYEPVYIFRF